MSDLVARARAALEDYANGRGQEVPAAGLIEALTAEVERTQARAEVERPTSPLSRAELVERILFAVDGYRFGEWSLPDADARILRLIHDNPEAAVTHA